MKTNESFTAMYVTKNNSFMDRSRKKAQYLRSKKLGFLRNCIFLVQNTRKVIFKTEEKFLIKVFKNTLYFFLCWIKN